MTAVSLGSMAAMHGAPRVTGIPADDVFRFSIKLAKTLSVEGPQ